MARDWLTIEYVNSISAALLPVRTHGKFLCRDGSKFLLKAMRLREIGGALDLSEKLALRRRLNEFAAANGTGLILTEEQAETVLSLAGPAGLYAMVELTIDPRQLNSPSEIRAALVHAKQTVSLLRGYPALIGFLIDCPSEGVAIAPPVFEALRSGLAAFVRAIRESYGDHLVGFERRANARSIVRGVGEQDPGARRDSLIDLGRDLARDPGEDITYANLAGIEPADLESTMIALHRLAAAHPLIVELGEELPGQEEMVVRTFGLGATGIVAPAMQPAASTGRRNVRMLSAGELLPFAHIEGAPTLVPADAPMVSVVVAARDNQRTIGACLESIGRLNYPNYEVIVTDDGSHDETAAVAAAPRDRGIFGNIRIIRGQRAGFGAACNAATRIARGQLIAFTRGDCVVDGDWLAMAVGIMHAGSLDACGGPIYRTRAADGIATRAIASVAHPNYLDAADAGAAVLADRNMIVRRTSLAAVGGFDARFTDGGGAADLSARMSEAEMALGWCPAGSVWRCASDGVGEFYRGRIGHGRVDAMLAIKHPERFGVRARRARPALSLAGGGLLHGDGARDGIVVRSLSAIFSLSGAIARSLACRGYTLAAVRDPIAAADSEACDYNAAHHLPIASNSAGRAHSASHH
jgi:GT2 family glycosyltransferase